MRIELAGKNMKLDDRLREHVDRRLHFSLKKYETEIERIDVTVADVNGPRGGVDKRCLLIVKLRSLGQVTIEDHDHDLFAVVARAAERVGRAVGRAIARKRDKKYQRRRMSAADAVDESQDQDQDTE